MIAEPPKSWRTSDRPGTAENRALVGAGDRALELHDTSSSGVLLIVTIARCICRPSQSIRE